MDVREKLEVIAHLGDHISYKEDIGICYDSALAKVIEDAYMTLKNGVTVQECAYWQYIEDDIDEDNNIQAYCSVCHAGDKHATSMIGKVPYCWNCGRKMLPQPPKGE